MINILIQLLKLFLQAIRNLLVNICPHTYHMLAHFPFKHFDGAVTYELCLSGLLAQPC
jgi:hypothetical protein